MTHQGEVETSAPRGARGAAHKAARALLAPDAVGLRQVPATVSLAISLVIVWLSAEPRRPALIVVAAVLVATAQVFASVGRWDRWPSGWRGVPPLAQIAAIALLEVGTGRAQATFDILLLLPAGVLALRRETWGPVTALGACGAALLVPVVAGAGRELPLVHAVVTFLVLAATILGAHAIVAGARRQADDLQRARDALALQTGELRRSRDDLRSILEAATGQAIVATDADGIVVAVSTGAERILARPMDALVGSDVTGLVVPEGPGLGARVPLETLVGQAARGGTHVQEWRATMPDGSITHLELVVTPRPGADPASPARHGYLVVATDVTARREEQRRQDDFIGLVSHELRTPLASIVGYLDLIRLEEGSLEPHQRQYLEVVERNATRLSSLVDDLLTSAQMAADAPMSAQEVDVAEITRASVTSQLPIARAAGVQVEVTGDSTAPLVSDPHLLAQVVDNLVSNAIKYSLSGGEVVVGVAAGIADDGGRNVRLSVVDEGTGIEPDELARITERFYRTRSTRRRRVRGVGLGLSLVQSIVDDHGGTLTIDSQPGHGTQVRVVLPDLPDGAPGRR